MPWKNVLNSRKGSGKTSVKGRDVRNQVAYSTSAKGKSNEQVAFTIGINVMKKARLQFRDPIVICKDGDMGLIKRENGTSRFRTLTAPTKNDPTCGVIKFTLHQPFNSVPQLIILEHEVTDDGIEFVWPKECESE
jgi:hypothetical protein